MIANIRQFDGFADIYDKFRPSMPSVIVDILTQLAHTSFPHLVVDLGCGTGLSTRTWAKRAENIIGVEPNDNMRSKAEIMSKEQPAISYQKGTATNTKLPGESADIATICQTIGWVQPNATFTEASRILRSQGIFAAVDYDVPPIITLEIDALEREFLENTKGLMLKHLPNYHTKHWDKKKYLSLMVSSGKFAHTKELAVHSKEEGNVERIIGFILTQSSVQTLLKNRISEKDIGLSSLRAKLHRILGRTSLPMYFTYRIRVGQKSLS